MDDRDLELLLVEDNPADVYLLEAALKQVHLPYKLSVAVDGINAWEQISAIINGETRRPDLVILDLNLPGLSGRQLLERLQEQQVLLDLPILVFTGSAFEQSIVSDFPQLRLFFQAKTPDFNELCDLVGRFDTLAASA